MVISAEEPLPVQTPKELLSHGCLLPTVALPAAGDEVSVGMILDRTRSWIHMIKRVVRLSDPAKAPEATPGLTAKDGKAPLWVVEEVQDLDILLGRLRRLNDDTGDLVGKHDLQGCALSGTLQDLDATLAFESPELIGDHALGGRTALFPHTGTDTGLDGPGTDGDPLFAVKPRVAEEIMVDHLLVAVEQRSEKVLDLLDHLPKINAIAHSVSLSCG